MWKFTSSCIAGTVGLRNNSVKLAHDAAECSDDDDTSSVVSQEEGLECPICWESFNIVENVPYVLWCGHTLCKNCILGLQWAVVKFPTLPIQLPLFISCPWCSHLSFRLVHRGTLKYPRKNYFLLWMVESRNGDRIQSCTTVCEDHHTVWSPTNNLSAENQTVHSNNHRRGQRVRHESLGSNQSRGRANNSFRKSLLFFVHLTAKFPLVLVFLLIVLYAIPASAAVLALYVLITILFALPSCLILYFSYPSLDWLVKEIIT